MKNKITLIISLIALIGSGVFLYDYANRGEGNCEGGDDHYPMTLEEKQYHDSVQAQSPIVQKTIDSIQLDKDKALSDRILEIQKLENPFIGKWKGVSDEIHDNDYIPKFEDKKEEFKRRNPFLSEKELNLRTQKVIEERQNFVAEETKRANNYFIEFVKVTEHGEGNSYHFVNNNDNTYSDGEWTVGIDKNDTTMWLLDNKTNKTYEHRLEKDENGHYTMRLPVQKKGKQNTKMKKIY